MRLTAAIFLLVLVAPTAAQAQCSLAVGEGQLMSRSQERKINYRRCHWEDTYNAGINRRNSFAFWLDQQNALVAGGSFDGGGGDWVAPAKRGTLAQRGASQCVGIGEEFYATNAVGPKLSICTAPGVWTDVPSTTGGGYAIHGGCAYVKNIGSNLGPLPLFENFTGFPVVVSQATCHCYGVCSTLATIVLQDRAANAITMASTLTCGTTTADDAIAVVSPTDVDAVLGNGESVDYRVTNTPVNAADAYYICAGFEPSGSCATTSTTTLVSTTTSTSTTSSTSTSTTSTSSSTSTSTTQVGATTSTTVTTTSTTTTTTTSTSTTTTTTSTSSTTSTSTSTTTTTNTTTTTSVASGTYEFVPIMTGITSQTNSASANVMFCYRKMWRHSRTISTVWAFATVGASNAIGGVAVYADGTGGARLLTGSNDVVENNTPFYGFSAGTSMVNGTPYQWCECVSMASTHVAAVHETSGTIGVIATLMNAFTTNVYTGTACTAGVPQTTVGTQTPISTRRLAFFGAMP